MNLKEEQPYVLHWQKMCKRIGVVANLTAIGGAVIFLLGFLKPMSPFKPLDFSRHPWRLATPKTETDHQVQRNDAYLIRSSSRSSFLRYASGMKSRSRQTFRIALFQGLVRRMIFFLPADLAHFIASSIRLLPTPCLLNSAFPATV